MISYLIVTEGVKVVGFSMVKEDLMALMCPFTHGGSLSTYSLLAGCRTRYLELSCLPIMSLVSILTASRRSCLLVQGPESNQRSGILKIEC